MNVFGYGYTLATKVPAPAFTAKEAANITHSTVYLVFILYICGGFVVGVVRVQCRVYANIGIVSKKLLKKKRAKGIATEIRKVFQEKRTVMSIVFYCTRWRYGYAELYGLCRQCNIVFLRFYWKQKVQTRSVVYADHIIEFRWFNRKAITIYLVPTGLSWLYTNFIIFFEIYVVFHNEIY